MRFKLTSDWPGPGNNFLEAGTVIDTDSPAFAWVTTVPMTVIALDQAAADWLSTKYPFRLHELRAQSPAVIREIIKTQ
jgi:hypothetical protein